MWLKIWEFVKISCFIVAMLAAMTFMAKDTERMCVESGGTYLKAMDFTKSLCVPPK